MVKLCWIYVIILLHKCSADRMSLIDIFFMLVVQFIIFKNLNHDPSIGIISSLTHVKLVKMAKQFFSCACFENRN